MKYLKPTSKTKKSFLNRKLKDISRQSMNFPVETAFHPTIKDIETKQKNKVLKKTKPTQSFCKRM